MKRLNCYLRHIWARIAWGVIWDGHCWDDDEWGVICIDCGKKEIYVEHDRCKDCGFEFENQHWSCQGHQNCWPECPNCGGDLEGVTVDAG